jgi:GDPmannose 4,6-dehydratase
MGSLASHVSGDGLSKTALITGITGQDGAYLAAFLIDKGYRVVGTTRQPAAKNLWRLADIGVLPEVELASLELTEESSIRGVLREHRPDEVYNLAAQSFVTDSFKHPVHTSNVDALGALRLLEGIRAEVRDAKFYQASTSEMFGKVRQVPQTEDTPFYPRSPYGFAKVFAHWAAVNYREAHGMFCVSGILFNHESPCRGVEFLTRKVTFGLAQYVVSGKQPLLLGNLDAQRDWGFAGDYVRGMWLMLQHHTPDDFVLATGLTHTVRDFVDMAASAAGLSLRWEGEGKDARGLDSRTGETVVAVDSAFYRPAEVELLVGDASKAKAQLGWTPEVSLERLVQLMVKADIARVRHEPLAALA